MNYLLRIKYADIGVDGVTNTSYQFEKPDDDKATNYSDLLVGRLLSSNVVFMGATLSRPGNIKLASYGV